MNFIIPSPKSAILFKIINYPIYWYGVILMISIVLGLFLSYSLIKKEFNKKQADDFLDFSPALIFFSIVGARLFYILGSYNFYINNPKEIIMINHGGLSIYGAIIFGILSLIYYLKRNKKDFYKYIDIISLTMPLSQAIGRWGNYFNQEAYGKPSDFFIKLYIEFNHRDIEYQNYDFFHPTFLYESVLNLVSFIVLFVLYKKKMFKNGVIFYLYLIFYSVTRFFIEGLRIDSVMDLNSIPIAQIISIIIFITSIVLLFKRIKANK